MKTIRIDAYVSPQVPAEYAAAQAEPALDALGTQRAERRQDRRRRPPDRELQRSRHARRADLRHRAARRRDASINGVRGSEEVFFGVAFSSGLDKVVIPFIDRGIPVEYELVRSICTVAGQQRKTLGVLKTDAQLFGGFSMQGPTEESQIITELKKQYDVVGSRSRRSRSPRSTTCCWPCSPRRSRPRRWRTSSQCVKSGQPTAIFEDPLPWLNSFGSVVGTGQPKQPPGGMMAMFGGQQPPEPKGDITQLWNLLGVEFDADTIIWQDFNPETKIGDIPKEWIFIDEGLTAQNAINPFNPLDPVSAGMRQVLFLVAGAWRPEKGTKLEFTELAHTGPNTGTISYRDYEMWNRSGGTTAAAPQPDAAINTSSPPACKARWSTRTTCSRPTPRQVSYSGTADAAKAAADAAKEVDPAEAADSRPGRSHDTGRGPDQDRPEEEQHRRVLVSDIDWIAPIIFQLREIGPEPGHAHRVEVPERAVRAEHSRFARRRRPLRRHPQADPPASHPHQDRGSHRGVSLQVALKERSKFMDDANQQIETVRQQFRDKIAELESRTDLDARSKAQQIEMQRIKSRARARREDRPPREAARQASQAKRSRARGRDSGRAELLQAAAP